MKKSSAAKSKGTGLPIFLCWMAYTFAYFGRYSYASNITTMISAFGVSHADAGFVSTCFFFAYGAGQLVNGILCKYYPKRLMITLSLLVSAAVNFLIFLGAPFYTLKYLWLCNGIAQSILWPSLIDLLSEELPPADLKSAIFVMSTTVPVGTIVSYGGSALFSALGGDYTLSFLLGAISMFLAAIVWFSLYKKAFRGANFAKQEAPAEATTRGRSSVLLLTIVPLALFAVINNLVKDGLTTWVPSILKENFGLADSLSILMTLTLPILGMFGAIAATQLRRKIKSFISLSGVFYLLSAVCILFALFFINTSHWALILLAFALTSLFMHSINNIVTSMAPLYLRGQINSGYLAGLLNACCYLGSTISSYGLGSVADHYGWGNTFLLLFFLCVPPILISAGFALAGKLKK